MINYIIFFPRTTSNWDSVCDLAKPTTFITRTPSLRKKIELIQSDVQKSLLAAASIFYPIS